MNTYDLLKVYPSHTKDGYKSSANETLKSYQVQHLREALELAWQDFPELGLNNNGYNKIGNTSYCIAKRLER